MEKINEVSVQHEILRRAVEVTTNSLKTLEHCGNGVDVKDLDLLDSSKNTDPLKISLRAACAKAILKLDAGLDKVVFE